MKLQMVHLLAFMALLLSGQLNAHADDQAEAELLFPALSQQAAWERLPPAEIGEGARLPNWALVTVDSLPATTAAMLELDWQHRGASPLGPILAGKIRWTVADANRCEYALAQATSDLQRAGATAEEIAALATAEPSALVSESMAIQFARKLTLNANEITDDEVHSLAEIYGEHKLVAIVLLVAYGNFQDRLLLALHVSPEAEGPVAPVELRFARDIEPGSISVPPREIPAEVAQNQNVPQVSPVVDDELWRQFDFTVLQQNLTQQRGRDGRIRVPTWDEVTAGVPSDRLPPNPVRIRWSLVCRGYQPELAASWSTCLRRFAEESQQDRVFEESVFWVITRTIHCFY